MDDLEADCERPSLELGSLMYDKPCRIKGKYVNDVITVTIYKHTIAARKCPNAITKSACHGYTRSRPPHIGKARKKLELSCDIIERALRPHFLERVEEKLRDNYLDLVSTHATSAPSRRARSSSMCLRVSSSV